MRLLAILLLAFAGRALAQAQGAHKGVTFFFAAHNSFAAAANKPKCCIGLNPHLKITIGEQAEGYLKFTCQLSDGTYLQDEVEMTTTGEPAGHGESPPAYEHNPVQTNPPSDELLHVIINTTEKSIPGNYILTFHGTSTDKGDPRCRDPNEYPELSAPLAVAPKVKGETDVWWFNKLKPPAWKDQTRITLTAEPSGTGPYAWKVKTGSTLAELLDPANTKTHGAKVTTKDTKVFVEGRAPSKDKKGDVGITVTVNEVESEPHTMLVKKPAQLKRLPECKSFRQRPCEQADASYGYSSMLPFEVLDQFGGELPEILVPLNEQWTSAAVYDYPSMKKQCNGAGAKSPPCWRRGGDCGDKHVCAEQNPRQWVDEVKGEDVRPAFGYVPTAQAPNGGTTAVQHWSGQWSVGGSKPGQGVRVQTNWWQKYQDHASYSHVVSPAP